MTKNFVVGVSSLLAFVYLSIATLAVAHDDPESQAVKLEPTVIEGRRSNLIGESISASEGLITQEEIDTRPLLRTGEILEFVPGLVVTQHSGTGKANQYFLRGFNLDHGTDFNTRVDGMPVNMRTHGHGQGYTDINFLIPELVQSIEYRKGPYYAEVGDFSGAGAAAFTTLSRIDRPMSKLGVGEDGYQRLVAIGDMAAASGNLLLAYEGQRYDGPWSDIDEDLDKNNVVISFAQPLQQGQLRLALMAYDNSWNSADQIPQRAVDQGIIDELGSLDTTVGGESSRYSLSGRYTSALWDASAYAIRYELDLWSNFTYFLDDPVNGDQFQQVDDRKIYGFDVTRHVHAEVAGHDIDQRLGGGLRYDDINDVALIRTRARQQIGSVRRDAVEELSASLYWQGETQLSDRLTGRAGLRYDYFDVDVTSDLAANSGKTDDDIISPKLSLTWLFNPQTEGYLSAGRGFHSNDARGATIAIDPVAGTPAQPVDLLVRSEGYEIGLRFFDAERLNLSVALWRLDLDSELLFVGDAGNTEASRASQRYGIETATYYWIGSDLSLDLELAWTRTRFSEDAPGEGNHIDGSLPFVGSAGVSYQPDIGWNSALRVRHFGERTLDSFDSVNSDSTTVTNLAVGYRWQNWSLTLDALNVLDSDDHDIDYFYASRLAGEPAAGVEDVHFHPIEPRTLRLGATYKF